MALHPRVAAVRLAVRRSLAGLPDGTVVLVACSGGPDSLALLAATVFEARGRRRIVGVTVDHGLQEGSAQRAEQVVARMAGLGVDETVSVRVTVQVEGGSGPEAAARQARYAVLDELAQRFDAAAVLLGHTRDDQAETVLLGLARGSGGRSLAGMRRGFGPYLRPLLDVSRDDTVTACGVEGIETWDDPHNADPGFTRVRVRRRVLPMLETELGPGVAATLARTADQLRIDMDFLDELAESTLAGLPRPLPVSRLAALATAVRRRVLRLAALEAGAPAAELFHSHLLAVDTLVTDWHGQQWIDLPGSGRGRVRALRRAGLLIFEVSPPGRHQDPTP